MPRLFRDIDEIVRCAKILSGVIAIFLLCCADHANGSVHETLHAGSWAAWIDLTHVDNPLAHAQRLKQTIFRQGPRDTVPVQLFEQTSTDRVSISLRDDGLLFVQAVGGRPALYFPNRADPVTLILPSPFQWRRPYPPTADIAGNSGYVVFLGDILFYGRYVSTDDYLIGFVRINAQKQKITENRVCLCVPDNSDPANVKVDAQANAWAANLIDPRPVRAGNFVFWKNRGDSSVLSPRAVEQWRRSETRILSLITGKLVPLKEVPPVVLQQHVKELEPFLQP